MIPREAADAITRQFEGALIEAGVKEDLFLPLRRVVDWLREGDGVLDAMRSREAMTSFLETLPSEAEAMLRMAVGMFSLLPSLAVEDVTRIMHSFVRDNPPATHPGRPKVMDDRTKREVCGAVLELFGQGTQLGVAQERIAQRFGLSLRAVHRAWKDRHLLTSTEPQSTWDVLKLIIATKE